MYTLIHRTGLSRGRVYNATGENLTANPVGAGNDYVGPFAQDYSSITFDQNVSYDHEFSGVIMDGRALQGGGQSDDSILYPDLDEDEDLSDRGSVVGRDTKTAALSSVTVKLTHTRPRWADAQVWHVPIDGTAPTMQTSLDEWLDADVGDYSTTSNWSRLRHYIQVPYYWQLYRIPLGPNYEGLAEMIAENSAVPVAQLGQLTYGPLGMLTALHGTLYASQHASRLYEPTSNVVAVERGYGLMPYDSAFNDNKRLDLSLDNDGQTDPDILREVDAVDPFNPATVTQGAPPSGYRRGGVSTWAVHSKRRVRAQSNEIYVWHYQTAPVRIGLQAGAGGGDPDFHVTVGNAVSPYYGPFVHLVYHECTARFSGR